MEELSISPAGSNTPLQRRLRQATLVAALAMLCYLGLAVATDGSVFLAGLQRLDIWQWLTLLGLSLLNYALRFVRWHGYLHTMGAPVPVWRDLGIYVAGFAFTVSPGKAGEAVRSVYLRDMGVKWSHGLAALAVERLLDLAAVTILAALAIQAFADYAAPAVVAVVLVAVIFFVATRPGVIHWLLQALPDDGRIGRLAQGTVSILDDSRILLTPGKLVVGMLLGVIAWGAEAWGFYLLLQWLEIDMGPLLAMGIYAVSMLAGALSFLPGGLGGAEAAMVALLSVNGVALVTAVLATFICRAVTLWFAVMLGVGAVMAMQRIQRI